MTACSSVRGGRQCIGIGIGMKQQAGRRGRIDWMDGREAIDGAELSRFDGLMVCWGDVPRIVLVGWMTLLVAC